VWLEGFCLAPARCQAATPLCTGAHQYPQLRGGRGFDRTKLELALAEKIAELDFDGDEPLAQNYTVHHTLVDLPSKVEIYCGDLCW